MRVPNHGCAGTWEDGITYTISRTDFGAHLRESSEFAYVLESGLYTYLEGHAKVSTTTDIYSHIIKKADEGAADSIAETLLRKHA